MIALTRLGAMAAAAALAVSSCTRLAESLLTLTFTQQPSDTTAGATIDPPVQVCVKNSLLQNVITSVTLELVNAPSGTVLSGTLVKTSGRDGIATFDDLSINLPASGVRLRASVNQTFPVLSEPFEVTPGP